MKEYLNSLVGKEIKVNRGGPESSSGLLLDVKDDFFTLLTKDDGVIYYKVQHIKSLTREPKKEYESTMELPEDFTYFQGERFKDILNSLVLKWVYINRGGPEKVEGVLTSVGENGISLVLDDEIVDVSDYHIKSVSYGNNPFGEEEDKDKEKDNKEGEQKNKKD